MNKKTTLLNFLLLTCFIGVSQVNLQITEIWAGNTGSGNVTEDWFEITNKGNVAWTPAMGNIYFDDDSKDFEDAALISGITSIQPGESVIAVNDNNSTEFTTVWSPVYDLSTVQIGTYEDGKGLGGGGDGVTLFMSPSAPIDDSTIIDFEAYPDTSTNGGQSYDVDLAEFSILDKEASYKPVATTTVNTTNQPAIGSPGNLGPVALVNLQITEIWAGNTGSGNVTEDWFEITNKGNMAWTPAMGNLYFDDDSKDFEDAALISGITSIQPGESVIAVNDNSSSEFATVWSPVYNLSTVQIGTYENGKGLGGGGDGVTLFMSPSAPIDDSTIIDFEAYPDTSANGGQSYDVDLAEFSILDKEASYKPVATTEVNQTNQPAIGSPGNLGPVALVNLQITEIWAGNTGSGNVTEDWFEITNKGNVAWTPAMGNLYFDDDSKDFEDAALISGITSIQPGESVIAVNDNSSTEFTTVWSPVYNLTTVQIGTYEDGKGLGGGGDGVTLFMSPSAPIDDSTIVDFEAYPDTSANGGQSYDVDLAEFSILDKEASYKPVATTTVNATNQPAIGSPGNMGPAGLVNLQITEIWPGNVNGGNLTEDWFEITNIGSITWTSAMGNLYFVDEREEADYAANAALLNGITSIQPGESIIVLGASNSTNFITVWGGVYDLTGVQIATHDGKGLGKGGDTVNIFMSSTTPTDNSTRVDSEAYPDTNANGGQSYDVDKGVFSIAGETPFMPAATAVNDAGESAIGSPGNLGPIASTSSIQIVVDIANITSYLNLPETNAGYVSGVVNDPTDPASTIGIPFNLTDEDTALSNLTVTVSSSDTSVVPNENLILTGIDGARLLKITPIALGFATITVTVEDTDTNTDNYIINYAASKASVVPSTSRFHTGAADGSAGIAIDNNYIWIGDDEDQTLRLYNGNESGLPIKEINFNTALGSNDEADLEGSFMLNNTIYWIGSIAEQERSVVFTTDLSGTGATSSLTYGDKYTGLRDDILDWDANNEHGLGANYFNLSSDNADGSFLEVEALALAPNSTTTAYIGIRNATSANKAIVIPVTNFTSLPGMSAGSATFGDPILLDLEGRSLRSMECNENGCVLIGGPFNSQLDFKLFTWTGSAIDQPELRTADLTALDANGSFEGLVGLPNSTFLGSDGDTDTVKLLVDLGATEIYEDGEENKDLGAQWKKFRSDVVTLGAVDTSLSITDVDTSENAIKVYPLPFSNEVHLALNMASTVTSQVQIVNMLGAVVYHEELLLSQGIATVSPPVNLPSGLYILQIPELHISKKIIKK